MQLNFYPFDKTRKVESKKGRIRRTKESLEVLETQAVFQRNKVGTGQTANTLFLSIFSFQSANFIEKTEISQHSFL